MLTVKLTRTQSRIRRLQTVFFSATICLASALPALAIPSPTFTQAMNAFDSHQYETAVTLFEREISISPYDVRAHYYRGMALQFLKRYPESSSEYDWVIHNAHDATVAERAQRAQKLVFWLQTKEPGANSTSSPQPADQSDSLRNDQIRPDRQTGEYSQSAQNQPVQTAQQPAQQTPPRQRMHLPSNVMIGPNVFGIPGALSAGKYLLGLHSSSQSVPAARSNPPVQAQSDSSNSDTRIAISHAGGDATGKLRIVDCYTDWCPVCRKFAPMFDQFQQKYGDQVQFDRINAESPMAKSFVRQYGIHAFPTILYFDEHGALLTKQEGAPRTAGDFQIELSQAFPSMRDRFDADVDKRFNLASSPSGDPRPSGRQSKEAVSLLDRRGYEALNAGDNDKAIAAFEKALSIDSNDRLSKHNLGVAYYNKAIGFFNNDQFAEAAPLFEKSIKLCKQSDALTPDMETTYQQCLDRLHDGTRTASASGSTGSTPANQPPSVEQSKGNQAIDLSNEGAVLLTNKKVPQAIEKFKQALELNPNEGAAHYNLALAYSETCKYKDVLLEADKAIALGADASEAMRIKGHAQFMLGLFKPSVETLHAYFKTSPTGEYVENARSLLALAETEAAKPEGNQNSADYVQQLRPADVGHWTVMPLTVYIKPGDGVPGFRPELVEILKKSFTEWETRTSGVVRFTFVNDPAQARLVCSYTNTADPTFSTEELGHTETLLAPGGEIHSADIRLLTLVEGKSELLTEVAHRTALHEIGHALGIAGHSNNPDDAMFMAISSTLTDPFSLSKRDVNTVRSLYNQHLISKASP